MQRASGIARSIVARFVPTLARTVNCSACNRARAEVAQMVSGPHVYICDRCIAQATRQLAPHKPAPDAVRCRFCRQLRAKDAVTAVGSVILCADCLGLMGSILDEANRASRPAT